MIPAMAFPLVIDDLTMPRSDELDGALPAMDEEEFRAFYERTARQLWSYLARISGDRQLADDLLQEAYYRFCRAGAKHESESHRRNSLFQIATNLVRDNARRGRRSVEVALREGPEGPEHKSEMATPEQEVAARTDLARAMQSLDHTQRQIVWLAYAQGVSHEEIAEIVGVRAISVRTILYRARRKLATALTATRGKNQEPAR